MSMYSFSFFKEQEAIFPTFMAIAAASIVAVLLISGYLWVKHRNDSKYRDLFIIFILLGSLLVCIQVSKAVQQKDSRLHTGQTIAFIKSFSKNEHIDPDNVYLSGPSLTDQMEIKYKNSVKGIKFSPDFSSYEIKDYQMINPENINYVKTATLNPATFFETGYGTITLKLILGFLVMILQINLFGKGNLAPTKALDQVQNYVLGGIIGGMIYNDAINVLQFFIVMLIWTLIVFVTKFLTENSRPIKKIIDGAPQVLISDGKLQTNTILKNGLSASDLMFKLRVNGGVNRIEDVSSAVLEQNGQITITGKRQKRVEPIIADGQINLEELELSHLTKDWVASELKQQGVNQQDVYLGIYKNGGLELITYPQAENEK